ncbi:MAG: hypothetical protein P4L46_22545 [Fimbriimonas sp.]|nr:hypothetical protein [Fimbriimonas sp.]
MNVQTYLYFPGTCLHAIDDYVRAFGAEVLYLARFTEAPEPLRLPGGENLVFHATLRIGETLLNLSDDPSRGQAPFGGFALLVHLDSANAVDATATVLAEEGQILVAAQETAWAQRYCIVTDRFGLTWKLQYSQP